MRYMTRAHPRSRGEHVALIQGMTSFAGSSPLARGTPSAGTFPGGSAGLIPARAGNTIAAAEFERRFGAHPRSRGEHLGGAPSVGFLSGSSPLARGTRVILLLPQMKLGLIPARAGNT